jgi:hypothetical protein
MTQFADDLCLDQRRHILRMLGNPEMARTRLKPMSGRMTSQDVVETVNLRLGGGSIR